MKIQDIRILPLTAEAPKGGWPEGHLPDRNTHTLLEIVTDEGVSGLGSVYTSARLVEASMGVLEPLLDGERADEPARVSEKLHQSTFWQGRGGALTHTISGIDIALWDILGKATGQPISRLLGGRYRERVKPYASLSMSRPGWLERAQTAVEAGFRAVKIGWGRFGRRSPAHDEKCVHDARDAIGPDVELMVDAGGSGQFYSGGYKWALATAHMLREYDVAFYEEALRPDDVDGYVRLTENAPLMITAGEVLTRRQAFQPWIDRRAVDAVQPDITKVGGLTEGHRIAMSAYDHGLLTVPHGWNTAIGLVADLHFMASVPVARWVEYLTPTPFIEDLLDPPPQLDRDGYLAVPDGPGLGVAWNQDGIEKHSGRRSSGQRDGRRQT